MLKTNSKTYLQNIEDYIFNCIDNTYFNLDSEIDKKESLGLLIKEFKRVAFYPHNLHKFKNNYIAMFADYLTGLPSNINVDCDYCTILEVSSKLHNIDSIPTKKEDIIINNWFNHISTNVFKLCKKYNINHMEILNNGL